MLHCLCSSERCRFCPEIQGCALLWFMTKLLFKRRPVAATYLCRFAAKARFDNRLTQGVRFPKGRGRNPSPFGRFKGKGFLRKGGNRNPPFLKWRSLVTFFRQGKKVTRRRQKGKGQKEGKILHGRTEPSAPTTKTQAHQLLPWQRSAAAAQAQRRSFYPHDKEKFP